MKIGIMGGTFDPIHHGHLLLGEFAYEQFGLDKIWFLPNGNPPHKDNETIESDWAERLEMINLAIEDVAYFELSLYEMEQKQTSYSYQTMEFLNEKYPTYEFYFILGADSLFTLDYWKNPERLLKACIILAAVRGKKDMDSVNRQIQYLNEKYAADVRLLRAPLVEISSSEIRERVKEQKSVRYLVPERVRSYISKNNIYV